MKKPETNEEFVKRLMTVGCPTGPMAQMFVIAAIDNYSREVIKAGAGKLESELINEESWVKTAEYMQEQLDNRA